LTKPTKIDLIRTAAEEDLYTFIKLVAPHRVLGECHRELIRWWTREDAKDHQLTLLPRDHQKSAMIAYRVAWEIIRNPAVTILYISSTSNLAEKQLKFIKDILDSRIVRRYWPDLLNPDEGKREKWSSSEIAVDHPIRKREGIRDPTVFTAGLTTSITGLHCNIAVLDDVVVQENAYTKEGRDKVTTQYSLLASIETTGAKEWVVGTRYHPDDLYGQMLEMQRETYTENGELLESEPIYELFQREVEDRGDGTGEFLWPRQQRYDGKWFGFNQQILATKRAQYLDKTQFRAQYYNNPNDPDNERISSDYFQYYDRKYLEQSQGVWYYRNSALNVYAAIDFAFSLNSKADYTAIAVVGINGEGNIYIMEIDRFRTNRITDYFNKIIEMHIQWGFRKIRAEVTVAQEAIVEELKDRIRRGGYPLSIDKYRPAKHEGTKEERIHAILAPRYENMSIWHYKGGAITDLEQELRMEHSRHDDMKDALANAISIAVAPRLKSKVKEISNVVPIHSRFGGVAFRG
jgi:phage terminase large subunit-like protein